MGDALRIGPLGLQAQLQVPERAQGMVLLATADADPAYLAQSQGVARGLHALGLGTLILELLGAAQSPSRHRVLELPQLKHRLLQGLSWLGEHRALAQLPIGLLGMGQAAAAALLASTGTTRSVDAIVTHDGRPDLAGAHLRHIQAPTLWITGTDDVGLLELQRYAMRAIPGPHQLETVERQGGQREAERLGELKARMASRWLATHLSNAKAHTHRALRLIGDMS